MAHLPPQFAKALENIEPSEMDTSNASNAHLSVREELEKDSGLVDLGIDSVLIGSYKRHVSIRRMHDVDVFCKLERSQNEEPAELLDLIVGPLISSYGQDRVLRQDRSVQVAFPDFDLHVDAVPARPNDSYWSIPDRGGEAWQRTNPERLTELSIAMNAANKLGDDGIYVPTVKLVRQLRRTHIERPGGLYFEILAYWAFESGISGQSVADYLTRALEAMVPVMDSAMREGLPDPALPEQVITTSASDADLDAASSRLKELGQLASSALDEEDDCPAAVMWRDLLGANEDGDVFPIPSYCNPDGTRKTFATITPGQTQVPSGEGRFA